MIIDCGVRRMKIRQSAGRILIFILALANVFESITCVSPKNTSEIQNLTNCGGEYFGYQYTIASPNYPENYPENQDCVYTLHGNRLRDCDRIFYLQFLAFAVPISDNCEEDYLEIGERSLYCGNVVGIRKYLGKHNRLNVRFHSDGKTPARGFKILVTSSSCVDQQIEKQADMNSTETSHTKTIDKLTIRNAIDEKMQTPSTLEPVEILKTEHAYAFNHPDIVEDNRRFENKDRKALTMGSSGKNEMNIGTSFRKIVGAGPITSIELPARKNGPFRDSTDKKVAIVTPIPMIPQEAPSPIISHYLFVPPASEKDSKNVNAPAEKMFGNASKVFKKNDVDNFIGPPPAEFVLPDKRTTTFRENGSMVDTKNSQVIEGQRRVNEKFRVPPRSYGVPGGTHYGIKTSQTAANTRENFDCEVKNNFEPDLEVTANFQGSNPAPIDNIGFGGGSGFRKDYYPATSYGGPGLPYPTDIPKVHFPSDPNPSYGPPVGNFPNGVSGSRRPSNWIPSVKPVPLDLFPNNDVRNRYPNAFLNPETGTGSIYPGNTGGYSQCCQTEYSAQRFLIASPGFPSLLYSGDSFDCIYSIRPYASNTCKIRFNFYFFNHGSEDNSCTDGYVEIDGRRICGCKRGLTIISPVATTYGKTIGVRYTGYPRTKFNGFVIEVVQEPCYDYPYLSRNKRDFGNFTNAMVRFDSTEKLGVTYSTSNRTKRNLGYSYPQPHFGLGEDPAVSQSWKPGHFGNTRMDQLPSSGGISGNLFAPISTCQALSFFDWINAAKRVYLGGARCIRASGSRPPIPGYPGNGEGNIPTSRCENINVNEGVVSSPQYPANYPSNLNECFRFWKYSETCQLEVAFLDFDLEDSSGCLKDYVSMSGQNRRYCGRSLAGNISFIDMSRVNFIDIYFVSDGYGSGRGFSFGFTQMPCRGLSNR